MAFVLLVLCNKICTERLRDEEEAEY
jgi:hypothetical protein